MVIGNGETLLMIGDSVTDCDRARPVGEGDGNMGNGYPRNVQALLDMKYPERHIRVLNMGIGGNTSRDLKRTLADRRTGSETGLGDYYDRNQRYLEKIRSMPSPGM